MWGRYARPRNRKERGPCRELMSRDREAIALAMTAGAVRYVAPPAIVPLANAEADVAVEGEDVALQIDHTAERLLQRKTVALETGLPWEACVRAVAALEQPTGHSPRAAIAAKLHVPQAIARHAIEQGKLVSSHTLALLEKAVVGRFVFEQSPRLPQRAQPPPVPFTAQLVARGGGEA